MILTWVFRALFVPLLVLAIITSNCSAAEAAYAADTVLALDVHIPLNDAFAARLGYQRWDAATYWTSTRSRPGCGLLFEYL